MRSFIILVVCLLASFSAVSQSSDQKLILPRFIVSVGSNFSTISGSDSWEGLLPGLHIGVGLSLDPGKKGHIAYVGQVAYDMIGSKYDETSFTGKVKLSYVNIPLTVQHTSSMGILLEAGLQPGFLTSARDQYEGNDDDYKDNINSFHFGIPIGVGYVIADVFGINLRYVQGVTNIFKESSDPDLNRQFVLRIFWMPGLKK
ncbi:MAG TPA: porin family protein [Lacibacter sp.]|nr:porin family protein [Lacibacter sp.]